MKSSVKGKYVLKSLQEYVWFTKYDQVHFNYTELNGAVFHARKLSSNEFNVFKNS